MCVCVCVCVAQVRNSSIFTWYGFKKAFATNLLLKRQLTFLLLRVSSFFLFLSVTSASLTITFCVYVCPSFFQWEKRGSRRRRSIGNCCQMRPIRWTIPKGQSFYLNIFFLLAAKMELKKKKKKCLFVSRNIIPKRRRCFGSSCLSVDVWKRAISCRGCTTKKADIIFSSWEPKQGERYAMDHQKKERRKVDQVAEIAPLLDHIYLFIYLFLV